MKKNNRRIKLFIGTLLSMILCISITCESYAYYCTAECYNICGLRPELAGNCSLDMSCPSACTGHHAAPCWIVFAEPTCTKSGKIQIQICDAVSSLGICHERDEFIYPAPLGHDYGAWYEISDTEHEHDCRRHCGEPGEIEIEGHTYNPKYPIAYKDNGDTHITTYKNTCTVCGYTYTETEEEPHTYKSWVKDKTGHTANRVCRHCAHEQNESINITAEPLDSWTTESGTIQGGSETYSCYLLKNNKT